MKSNSVLSVVPEPPLAGLVVLAVSLLCGSFVAAESTLNFPRLDFDPTTFTGLAIVNPSAQDAVVTFTSYGTDGQPIPGVTNPAPVTILAGQQLVGLTTEFFTGSPDPSTVGGF